MNSLRASALLLVAFASCAPFVDIPGPEVPDAGSGDDAGALESDAGALVSRDAGATEDAGPGEDAGMAEDGGLALLDAGTIETCSSCHGSAANAAPPRDTAGRSDPALITVGAHQAHLRSSAWHRDVLCADCHLVPSTTDAPGHLDPAPAELVFSALANQGVTATWANGACTTYCHGPTLAGGLAPTPAWTRGATTPADCIDCHGLPPPPPHPRATACSTCHPNVRADLTFAQPQQHIDGVLDLTSLPCGLCHGVPPTTGAHLAHYGEQASPPRALYGDLRILEDFQPDGGATYLFGCGQCHPLELSKHLDGVVQVELHDPAAPMGSLKARNPSTAAYAGAPARTCANVACHSSGEEAPAYVTTPGWNSRVNPGCDGCHGNPPRYPSTDAGVTNGHLWVDRTGWEYGHFGGLMESHGGPGAGAITCQACHFDTVDPANTGPSGFYYLDTTGTYAVPGGNRGFTCANASCHTASSPVAPLGVGRVLPLRHVNGRRDVVFDRRTALPASYDGGIPTPPTSPFWMWGAWSGGVVEKDLVAATYQPVTKTCTNVSCHQGILVSSPAPRTVAQWGVPGADPEPCNYCH